MVKKVRSKSEGRSRARSRSRHRVTAGKHVQIREVHAQKPHATITPTVHLQTLLPMLRPLVASLKQKSAMLEAGKTVYLTDKKIDMKGLQDSVDAVSAEIALLRDLFRSSNKLETLGIALVVLYTNTSAANTAQAPVNALVPGATGEFGLLASLFDEFIADSFDIYWDVGVANSSSTDIHAAIAYDPINSAAYGGIAGILEASQFDGPTHISLTSRTMSPLPATRTGMLKKRFVAPKGPEVKDPNTASLVGTGQWTSTQITTTVYGYLKSYVEAPNGGNTTALTIFTRMNCRFRSRS